MTAAGEGTVGESVAKAEGHGLGLAICRSIVAQMRGQFQIESSPGVGTRIKATLPAQEEGPA